MDNNSFETQQTPEVEINNITEEAFDPIQNEKTVRKKVSKIYNFTCLSLLFQFGIASVISGIISAIKSAIMTVQLLPLYEHDVEVVMEKVMESTLSPGFLLFTTAISYLIANIVSCFIGDVLTKKHYNAKIFGKIQMKPLDVILSILSIIGIQMISVILQSVIMVITGMTGVDETTAGLLSFSDNAFHNFVLVFYTVVIAAITEELLCRGIVLKALSVKSKVFALFASSLLFGIMHGNFNQFFNGFLLGLVFGYVALKSKSIILPMILHMCANGHAMLISFLQYKFGDSIVVFQGIYIYLMAGIGVVAIYLMLKRNGLPSEQTDGYVQTQALEGLSELENQKGLTWKTLVKAPMFWIFVGIYLFTALASLTPYVM